MKKVVNIAVNMVFIFMMLTAAALIILRIFGYTAYSVKTPSMYPVCPVGTMIFVAKTDFDDFSEGDIVTYKLGEAAVTHRVYNVNTKARTLITKGDNNDVPDNVPVLEENIIGRVEFYIPYAGYLYIFAETIYGKICIVSAFVFLAVLSVLTENSEDDEDSEKVKISDKNIQNFNSEKSDKS